MKVKIFHEKGPDFRTFSLSIADYLFRLPSSTDTFTLLCRLKQQLEALYSSSYLSLTRDLREYDFMVIFGFKLIEYVGDGAVGIDKEA